MRFSRGSEGLLAMLVAVMIVGSGCGGNDGEDDGAPPPAGPGGAVTQSPEPSPGSIALAGIERRLEGAGYRVRALEGGNLVNFVPGGKVVAEAGLSVTGVDVEDPSQGNEVTIYSFANPTDADALGSTLDTVAHVVVAPRIYFVGQSPPSAALDKLVAIAEGTG